MVRDFFLPARRVGGGSGKSSPCMRKVGRNRRFGARWESFVPGGPPSRACWESSVPGGPASRAAGRVLYRLGPSGVCAGRVLYRKWLCVRDKVRPACRVGGGNGTKFSLLAQNGPKSAFWGSLGEFCTGWACQGRLLGEFCTGSGPACGIKFSLLGLLVAEAVKSSPCMRKVGRNRRFGACWESFVPGGPAKAACWESFVPGGPPSRVAGRVLSR